MILKIGIFLMGLSSIVTTVVGTTSGSAVVAIISILSALLVAVNACFITHYLKHIDAHKNVVEKVDCERAQSKLEKHLCLIIKHFNITEEPDSVPGPE